ncbi:hypothetical protein [Geofilum rubicundum]|uniref:BioF2-like acetyltransferase domain-containing protein n=1 Tax=Geofilum rubicundum JCM 15548 TaxID=1236989 RepID=A0A0E9LY66_9BACT|nr:hypothetical protein [Geofilum rubicundum]GAO30066.1 hypothetical protein JCM15548_12312 [Geofilum rubicundum JCM 15548]
MKKNDLIQLRHDEIDKAKWDAGIARSFHPLIYAESWYLDIVSPKWEAIVSTDYGTLWPLTINRKLKWPVIMQPMFTQQLGLFSSQHLDDNDLTRIFNTNKYPVFTLQNHSKIAWPETRRTSTKSNYILGLEKPYPELKKTFSKNCQRNIKKALSQAQTFGDPPTPPAFIAFTRQHKNYLLTEKHLLILQQIIEEALHRKTGFLLQVTDLKGAPLAMAFFLKKHQRLTFLSGQSSPEGFQHQSMFLIMHQVIQSHAASDLTLDFEGSEVPGIARFYRSFGAITETCQYFQSPWLTHLQKIKKRFSQKNS